MSVDVGVYKTEREKEREREKIQKERMCVREKDGE